MLLIGGLGLQCSFAQNTDTLVSRTGKRIIERFPSSRTIDVQYNLTGDSKLKSKGGKLGANGQLQDLQSVRVNANIPFLVIKKKLIFALNGAYNRSFGRWIASPEQQQQVATSKDINLAYWSAGVNSIYITELDGRPLIFSGSFISDGDKRDLHAMRGLMTAFWTLKSNEKTKLSLGLVGIIDRMSPIPALPVVSYERHLGPSPWTLELFFPQKFMLERKLGDDSQLFLGAEIDTDRNYYKLSSENLDGVYVLGQASINSGVTFERRFFNHVYLSLKAGLSSPLESRFVEKNHKVSDYIFKYTRESSWYARLGLSYNLF